MDTTQTTQSVSKPKSTGCCPPFDPAPYDEKQIEMRDELFVKEHLTTLFHMPLRMEQHVLKASAQIEAAGARSDFRLMLAEDTSPFATDLYIRASKPVPNAEMTSLPGTYLTKVFEGPYRDAPTWARRMREFATSRGKTIEKLYFAYTTCPACAKVYGKNYVVLFAKVG